MSKQDDNEYSPQQPGPEELDRQLQEYVDGTLSHREREKLETRLERDESLRAELDAYRSLQEHLDEELDHTVPGVDYEGMREEILAAVERKVIMQGPSTRRMLRWPRVAAGLAAAAAIVIAVSVWLTVYTGPRPGPPVEEASVSVVPPAPETGGEEVASVSLAHPQWDQVVLSPEAIGEDARNDLPAGTVMLSVGDESAGEAASMEHPILVH
jgi:hypothetical protein